VKKYCLGLLHFNIQFVAGEIDTYHREVRESFSPVIDFLFDHPELHFDVEMQGHMVEFMAEHYPHALQRLVDLVSRKQVELISCHYSDQIWIAFPKKDMLKSIELNDRVLRDHGLERSRVFFTQENFSGEGVAELAEFFDICIFRSDYYTHFQPIDTLQPYYTMGKMKVVIAPDSGRCDDLAWTWAVCGDGEPITITGMPNDVMNFFFNPRILASFAQRIANLKAAGFEFSSVGEFVEHVDKKAFKPEAIKPVLDGSWHMFKGDGAFQWMGRYAHPHEKDWTVRSYNVRSRNRLLALETLLAHAKKKGVDTTEQEKVLEEAWRHQLLAENSDPTGWIPTEKEVNYAIEETNEALNLVRNAVDYLKVQLGLGVIQINTKTGTVSKFQPEDLYVERVVDLDDIDFMGVEIFGAEGTIRQFQETSCRTRLCVEFTPTDTLCGVKRPYDVDYLQYSPALMEDRLVRYRLDAFRADKLYLPLTNGLITIRDKLHLIKHNETTHIACLVDKKERLIKFQMENAPRQRHASLFSKESNNIAKQVYHWEFTLYEGTAEEALEYANRINVTPTVVL